MRKRVNIKTVKRSRDLIPRVKSVSKCFQTEPIVIS